MERGESLGEAQQTYQMRTWLLRQEIWRHGRHSLLGQPEELAVYVAKIGTRSPDSKLLLPCEA